MSLSQNSSESSPKSSQTECQSVYVGHRHLCATHNKRWPCQAYSQCIAINQSPHGPAFGQRCKRNTRGLSEYCGKHAALDPDYY